MNHSEAVEQMAAERYLLNELAPDARDAFEAHMFDCPECAFDLRAGAAFVQEAKIQLPAIAFSTAAPVKSAKAKASAKPSFFDSLWRPAFVAPAFAALLLVLVFQNAVTFPALRSAATQPRLVPLAPLRSAARGASHLTITADRAHGVALPIDLPVTQDLAPAVSYSFELRDPQEKLAFSAAVPAPAQNSAVDQAFSLVIPGSMLRNGAYSLTVTSVSAQGERVPVEEYIFDIVMTD
jgi:anti-sigma factor RsiW